MKKLTIIGIIMILFINFLSGCTNIKNNGEIKKFIGTWVYEGSDEFHTDSFIFYNNGSVYCIYHWPGSTNLLYQWNNYTVLENNLKIGESVYEYLFSNNEKQLTLTMVTTNTSYIYTKQ